MSKRKDGQARGKDTLELKLARRRAKLARVKMERDILKSHPGGLPRPICIETSSAYTAMTL